jgi:transcriptional regulator, abrB family
MKIKRKISQKNRIQIPTQITKELGILEGETVLIDKENEKITIEKVQKI